MKVDERLKLKAKTCCNLLTNVIFAHAKREKIPLRECCDPVELGMIVECHLHGLIDKKQMRTLIEDLLKNNARVSRSASNGD